MTWQAAAWKGSVIVGYFIVATVWLPDVVLGLSFIQEASNFVRDAVASIVWTGAVLAGLVGLRRAQARGLI